MYTDAQGIIYLFIYRADVAEDSNTHWLILLKPSGSRTDKVPLRLPMIYQFAMFVKMALSFNSGRDWLHLTAPVASERSTQGSVNGKLGQSADEGLTRGLTNGVHRSEVKLSARVTLPYLP